MKEQLQIVLRKNRRAGDLIQVAKKSENEKICLSYHENDSAISSEPILSEPELFEIEWFDQMVKFFIERTESQATELERYRLFMPEKLYQAMYLLWVKCKENNIDYRPMDSMLKSIINKIKATETLLYEKTGEQLNTLEKINYKEPIAAYGKDEEDAKTIFNALIKIPDFFDKFNRFAQKKYHKSSTIKLVHFKGYAKAYNLPPKWVYACAIDVIAEQTNPLSVISEDGLFVLWVKPSLRSGTNKQELINQMQTWSISNSILDKTKNYNDTLP